MIRALALLVAAGFAFVLAVWAMRALSLLLLDLIREALP